MAKNRYVCRLDNNGQPKVIAVPVRVSKHDDINEPFDSRMYRAYYQKECEDGARFRSGYSKAHIKRTWETQLARGEQ